MTDFTEPFREAIFNMERDKAHQVVKDALINGLTPEMVVEQIVIPAMETMTQALSEHAESNLALHYMASQISAEVTDAMLKKFTHKKEAIGRVILGTTAGDLHTLGKRIVYGCCYARMIDIIDIGANISAEKFVEEAVRQNAQVIAVSAMMVHTAKGKNGPIRIRELLKEKGLEKQIKLVVGGAPFKFDPTLWSTVGADDWAEDGVTAAKKIETLIKAVKHDSL
jgi:methanogenic corrinoid protein MtbC1